MVSPSTCDTITDAIVTSGAVPLNVIGGPGTLLTTTTAIAPAAWALKTWVAKGHDARFTMAILPGAGELGGNGVQASLTRTNSPRIPPAVRGGPKARACGFVAAGN